MKAWFVLAVFLSIISTNIAFAQSLNNDKIVLGTTKYPPYIIVNDDHSLTGTDADVVRAVFKRLNIPLEIRIFPWNRAIQKAIQGEHAGVISCSPRSLFIVSAPISEATHALYMREDLKLDRGDIQSIADLKRYPKLRVGGVSGYKQLRLLAKEEIPYDLSPDDKTAFAKLFAGRIDIFLTYKQFADYKLKQLQMSHLVKHVTFSNQKYHVCFSRFHDGSEELKNRFNQALLELIADGTYDKIHAKYK